MAEKQWERLRKKIIELSFKEDPLLGGNLAAQFVNLHKNLEFMLHESGLYTPNEISNFTRRMDQLFLEHLADVNTTWEEDMALEWYKGFDKHWLLENEIGFAWEQGPHPDTIEHRFMGLDQPEHREAAQGWFTTNKIVGLDLQMQGTIKHMLTTDLFSPQPINPFKSMEEISGLLGVTKVAGGDRMIADTGVTSRAEKIYRTEAMATQNFAKWQGLMNSYDRDPATRGVWLAAGDFRTRDSHLQAHGQVRSPYEVFHVGGETARFPGDPSLSAKERINCRCTVVPYKEIYGSLEDVFGPINGPVKDALQARDLSNQWLGYDPKLIKRPGMTAPVFPVPPEDFILPEGVFPKTYEQLEFVESLGGTTGARLMIDPKTGRRYVVKTGASPEHLLNEMAADAAYRAAGIRVPAFRRYETPAGPVKVSEYLDGRLLSDMIDELTEKELFAIYDQLQEGFALDAFLGNWDVMGTGFDNILIDGEGIPWRIDNGGAINYRAMGARKQTDAWVEELWSMRDEDRNRWTFTAFGDMDYEDIHDGIGRVVANYDVMDAAVMGYSTDAGITLGNRIENYEYLWDIGFNMGRTDSFEWEYIDNFSKHFSLLGREGIQELWSEKMIAPHGTSPHLEDEYGKDWGSGYRGTKEGGFFTTFQPYAKEQDLAPQFMTYWAGSQAQSSWSKPSQAIKYYYANVMSEDPENDFWWRQGYNQAESNYLYIAKTIAGDQETLDQTLSAWHAYNYWSMLETELPFADHDEQWIELLRSESENTMSDFSRGDTGITMKRGSLESSSLVKATMMGSEMTINNVPYHRVWFHYLHAVDPHDDRDVSPLYSNGESEFLFLPFNLYFDYRKER